MTPVLINLDVEFKSVVTLLDVVIKLDDTVILSGIQSEPRRTITIDTVLPLGRHSLTIDLLNKNYSECSAEQDAAVIIHSLRFQHLPNEFKHCSWYRPDYPHDWSGPREEVILANYLGWNGRWGIDFTTPIYPWIHETLKLGWLATTKPL